MSHDFDPPSTNKEDDPLRAVLAAAALAGIMAKAATTTMSSGTRKAVSDLTWQIADDVLSARLDKAEVARHASKTA